MSDLDLLQRENARLKAELSRLAESEKRATERRRRVIRASGRVLIPLFDRQHVVRSFLDLAETAQSYAGPEDHWPKKDEIVEKTKLFALASLRFFVRRRLLMLGFSLLAFTVPALQLYVALQQNRIIENQNKYFNIQLYDTVARSLTSGDLTSKQITAALLAREDFEMLNGIIQQVFATDGGGAFTAQDAVGARPLILKEAAARGHLIGALVAALERQSQRPAAEVWREIDPTIRWIVNDAATRVPQLLRFGAADDSDPAVLQECYRYLFNLGALLGRSFRAASTAREEPQFFQAVAPLLAHVSQARPRFGEQAFTTVFASAAQEFVLDLALASPFGAPPAQPEPGQVTQLLEQGMTRLKAGVVGHSVSWDNLRRLFGI